MLSSVHPVEDRHKELIQKLKEATETLGNLARQASSLGITVWLHAGTKTVRRPVFRAELIDWDEAYQLKDIQKDRYG